MRLDHLLSKERISTGCFTVESSREPWGCGKEERKQRGRRWQISGGDAPGGHTRSHPEHDG